MERFWKCYAVADQGQTNQAQWPVTYPNKGKSGWIEL